MAKNGTEARVAVIPDCDICKPGTAAVYDAKTVGGPWAYLCEHHYDRLAVKPLGLGKGQRLVVA